MVGVHQLISEKLTAEKFLDEKKAAAVGIKIRRIKKIPLGRGSQGERGGIMEIALHYLGIIITYIFSSARGKRSFFEVFFTIHSEAQA